MEDKKVITLTSDFGYADSYVAQIKGVIHSINPTSTIIDVTHEISKFNIQTGAFMLASAAPYFPKGTVHVAVVDPGVGTKRRALAIKTKQGYFVGPDNGLLILAAERQGITGIYELTNPKYMLPEVSGTFHGRDVFAPAAAYIEKGVNPARFGPKVEEPVRPEFVQVKHEKDSIIGRILHVDSFGNIITNLRKTDVPKETLNIKIQDTEFKLKLKKTYGETKPKDTMALIGSHGFLEIAINRGNAAEKFNAKMGTEITITPN
jgi:S-adenosylmethionine hydrolase